MNRIYIQLAGWLLAFAAVIQPVDAGPLKSLWKSARGLVGKALGETTESGGKTMARNLTRHADDAARAVIRSSDGLAKHFGDDAAGLAEKLSPQEVQRLVGMADELKASGKADEVIGLLNKGGRADEVMNFLGRHRGTLATGAAVSILVANPDAVLNSAEDLTVGLANAAGQYVAEPMIETGGGTAVWGFMMLVSFGLFLLAGITLATVYAWWKGTLAVPLSTLRVLFTAWIGKRYPRGRTVGTVMAEGTKRPAD